MLFKRIDMAARRAVAWPLVIFASLLSDIVHLLLVLGAWLLDQKLEDIEAEDF